MILLEINDSKSNINEFKDFTTLLLDLNSSLLPKSFVRTAHSFF